MIEGEDHSIIEVRGTDASERSIDFTTTGTLDWKIGMDNVAAIEDNFVITQTNNTASPDLMLQTNGELRVESLSGTGTRVVVADADGDLSTQNSIGASASVAARVFNTSNDWGDLTVLGFSSERFDFGANLGTSSFTVPENGYYSVSYDFNVVANSSVGTGATFNSFIYFSGTRLGGAAMLQESSVSFDNGEENHLSGHVSFYAETGEVITLRGQTSSGSGAGATRRMDVVLTGSNFEVKKF
jgi:hypothetical protein